jgi:hypothetical protein
VYYVRYGTLKRTPPNFERQRYPPFWRCRFLPSTEHLAKRRFAESRITS